MNFVLLLQSPILKSQKLHEIYFCLMAQAKLETFWSLSLTFMQVSEPFCTCLPGKVDRDHGSHENHENRLPELV